MPARPLDQAALREVIDLVEKHGSVAAAARVSGIPVSTLGHRFRRACGEGLGRAKQAAAPMGAPGAAQPDIVTEGFSDKTHEGVDRELTVTHRTIKTVEDALKYAEVDTKLWHVERQLVNSWEGNCKIKDGDKEIVVRTPLWQVKVWLKPRKALDVQAQIEAVFAVLKAWSPKHRLRPIRHKSRDILCEIAVPDLHIGKLAWKPEAGENYDSKIAVAVYEQVVDTLVNRINTDQVDRFLMPIGNDLLHVDTTTNTTVNGTPQSVDGRWQKSFQLAFDTLAKSIFRLAEIRPVDVVAIPGNHDRTRVWFLGLLLSKHFEFVAPGRVTVDTSPLLRKYVRWGDTLLGFTHGDEERHDSLESVMIRERREDAAQCNCREWHLGHLHKRKITKYVAGDTHGGTIVRILPSLSGTDEWHYRKGYVRGPRAADAYLFHRQDGFIGHFSASAPPGVYE